MKKKSSILFLSALAVLGGLGCGGGGSASVANAPTPGSAVRVFSVNQYAAGSPMQVTVQVYPLSTSEYYAVEDAPPAGWTVNAVSNEGSLDSITGMVKWGPFADNMTRTLTYTITPPAGATGPQTFTGTLSLDGTSTQTAGGGVLSD